MRKEMNGIGVDNDLLAYVVAWNRRGAETVQITSDWMQRTFDTRDLTLVCRYIGDAEFRVMCTRETPSHDIPSVIGDDILGTAVILGFDGRRNRLRSLTDDEVRTVEWATGLYRWEGDDRSTSFVVAVEMYKQRDRRCPFEVMG